MQGGVNDLGRNQKRDVFACFLKRGGGGQRKVFKLDTKTKTLEGYPISLQISSFPLSPRALAKTPLGPVVSATFTSFVPKAKNVPSSCTFLSSKRASFQSSNTLALNTSKTVSLPLTNDGGKLKSSLKSNLKDM